MPRTRVASADAAPTVVLSPQAGGAAPARRRRRMPLLAAAGIIAVLMATGAAWTMTRDRTAGAAEAAIPADGAAMPDSLAARAQPVVPTPLATVTPSSPDVPDDTSFLRRPAGSIPVGSDAASDGRRGSAERDRPLRPAAIRARLRAARGTVEASMQADQVDGLELRRTIGVLTRMLPAVTTYADSVEARYLRAQALGLVGDTARSCRELDALASLELERQLRTEIDALRASACQ